MNLLEQTKRLAIANRVAIAWCVVVTRRTLAGDLAGANDIANVFEQ